MSSCKEILYSSSNEWTRVTNIDRDESDKPQHWIKKTAAENKENDSTYVNFKTILYIVWNDTVSGKRIKKWLLLWGVKGYTGSFHRIHP